MDCWLMGEGQDSGGPQCKQDWGENEDTSVGQGWSNMGLLVSAMGKDTEQDQ